MVTLGPQCAQNESLQRTTSEIAESANILVNAFGKDQTAKPLYKEYSDITNFLI